MAISPQDRAKLVALARDAVAAEVAGMPLPVARDASGVLGETRGCFVTLTNRGRLRGCIGTFCPNRPLAETIIEMGSAAAQDPRFTFNRIVTRELPELTVEVSVLSPLEKTSEPEKLRIGEHGIYIIHGGQAGCFLPEVATDMNWSTVEFLDNCCESKAGLPAGAWRDKNTQVYLFTSEKFDH
jgi:AmmeMemoRadiSam system protein A